MEQNLIQVVKFKPEHTVPTILCCNCGNIMQSNGLNMCNDCIAITVDLAKDVQKEGVLTFCKNCERVLVPPNVWIYAPRESRELLGSCLKRLRGLSKLKIIDARFLWTEPHSRRTKMKIKVQGEAKEFANTQIQQSFEVEFTEVSNQCPDCAKSYTANTWRASIQIRQKVEHKKTFLYLEQLILKNRQHKNTVSIQESKEGLDFFYGNRNHAVKMIEFLTSVVPAKVGKSSELISTNVHTSIKSYKFSYSVEIVPICRDDLVVLPKKVATSLGSISQLVLCHGIGNTVHFIDPKTLKTAELTSANYWKTPFSSLATAREMTEFMVLDVEPIGAAYGKFILADVTIARTADMGRNDTQYIVRTHLGGILHPGDYTMGYYLVDNNFNSDLWDSLKAESIPDVILVRKSYPDKTRNRNWKLKRMAKEYNEEPKTKNDAFERQQREYEEFLRELEEDPEIRQDMNLYKKETEYEEASESENESDGDDPLIKLEELKLESDSDNYEDEAEEEGDDDEDIE